MTKAKAMTVASALINQGFAARIHKSSEDEFSINIELASGINIDTVKVFADNNSVMAITRDVTLQ